MFETFPLNNLLAAIVVLQLVRWQQEPTRTNLLVSAALVTGLGVGNHLTIGLLGPAILWLLWRQRTLLMARPAVVLACLTALVLGLAPYLYIPLAASREPMVNCGRFDL